MRGITLGVETGECFGLLGPNGAGKTTSLALLTGEVRPPSAGSVDVFGHDLMSAEGLAAARDKIGFCPQVDPIFPGVSGEEHLRFFGTLKGVPEADLERMRTCTRSNTTGYRHVCSVTRIGGAVDSLPTGRYQGEGRDLR